jgi:hypothetical protein
MFLLKSALAILSAICLTFTLKTYADEDKKIESPAPEVCIQNMRGPKKPVSGPLVEKLNSQVENALASIIFYHGQNGFSQDGIYPFSLELKRETTPLTAEENSLLETLNASQRIKFHAARKKIEAETVRQQFVKWLESSSLAAEVKIGEIDGRTNVLKIFSTFKNFNKIVRIHNEDGDVAITGVGFYAADSALFQKLSAWEKTERKRGHIVTDSERRKRTVELRTELGLF